MRTKQQVCKCGHVKGTHERGFLARLMRRLTGRADGTCELCNRPGFIARVPRLQKSIPFHTTKESA